MIMKLWREKFIYMYYLIYLEKQNKFNVLVYIFYKLRFIYRFDYVYVC